MSLWAQSHRFSHVATIRTAAKPLFSLEEKGKGRKLELVGGGGGVLRPVVAAIIIIIIITEIVYLRPSWNREDTTSQCGSEEP